MIRLPHILLLTVLPLAACSQPTLSPSAAAPTNAPHGLIAEQVDKALTQARKELREGNLSLNGELHIGDRTTAHHAEARSLPKAEITPQGDLLIEGTPVPITPAQRQQLLDYRTQMIALAEAGMEIGRQGAEIAGDAVSGALGAALSGEQAQQAFERQMEAKGQALETQARALCARLPALQARQQALAAALPAFRPYARITQADIDDCLSKQNGKPGAAVFSD